MQVINLLIFLCADIYQLLGESTCRLYGISGPHTWNRTIIITHLYSPKNTYMSSAAKFPFYISQPLTCLKCLYLARLLTVMDLDVVFPKRSIDFTKTVLYLPVVNRGKWLGNLAKFFVVCFCALFWDLTLHTTWQNTNSGCMCSFEAFRLRNSRKVDEHRKEMCRVKDLPT